MLERSVVEKSVVEKCCRGVFEKSVGGDCWRSVVEKSVVEKCWREVLEKSLVEECWGEVLEKSVGEKCCREEYPHRGKLLVHSPSCHAQSNADQKLSDLFPQKWGMHRVPSSRLSPPVHFIWGPMSHDFSNNDFGKQLMVHTSLLGAKSQELFEASTRWVISNVGVCRHPSKLGWASIAASSIAPL